MRRGGLRFNSFHFGPQNMQTRPPRVQKQASRAPERREAKRGTSNGQRPGGVAMG